MLWFGCSCSWCHQASDSFWKVWEQEEREQVGWCWRCCSAPVVGFALASSQQLRVCSSQLYSAAGKLPFPEWFLTEFCCSYGKQFEVTVPQVTHGNSWGVWLFPCLFDTFWPVAGCLQPPYSQHLAPKASVA